MESLSALLFHPSPGSTSIPGRKKTPQVCLNKQRRVHQMQIEWQDLDCGFWVREICLRGNREVLEGWKQASILWRTEATYCNYRRGRDWEETANSIVMLGKSGLKPSVVCFLEAKGMEGKVLWPSLLGGWGGSLYWCPHGQMMQQKSSLSKVKVFKNPTHLNKFYQSHVLSWPWATERQWTFRKVLMKL